MKGNDFMDFFEAINSNPSDIKSCKAGIKQLQDSLATISRATKFKETIIEIGRLSKMVSKLENQ